LWLLDWPNFCCLSRRPYQPVSITEAQLIHFYERHRESARLAYRDGTEPESFEEELEDYLAKMSYEDFSKILNKAAAFDHDPLMHRALVMYITSPSAESRLEHWINRFEKQQTNFMQFF
jgi:hypothetical protein